MKRKKKRKLSTAAWGITGTNAQETSGEIAGRSGEYANELSVLCDVNETDTSQVWFSMSPCYRPQ